MITIYNYLKAGNNIYSSNILNYDYMNSDVISALELTLKNKYGSLCLFTDDETEIQNMIDAMFTINAPRYYALYNIDMVNDPSIEFYEKETNSGTVTTTDSGTVSTESTPEVIATTTENKNTADNATMRAVGSIVNSSTGSDTVERTDDLTFERTDDLTREREGFNNMIENAERIARLMNNAIFDIIIKDTLDTLTYNIYGKEDLTL
ncbi:MAG: hypothetical protein IKZ64_01565 [Alphaproteobacteria bacterium]|nr:hypothetical protein [Alphaproteobacteria bacterium]